MIEITGYRPEHFTRIITTNPRSVEGALTDEAVISLKAREKEQGDAWTMLVDGNPVACGGFFHYANNEAEAWYLISPDAAEHTKLLLRVVRGFIETFITDKDVLRLKAFVDMDDEAGKRWAGCMGFTIKDPLEIYHSEGREYALYERLP